MSDAFENLGNLAKLEGKKSLGKLQEYLKVKGILLRRKICPSGDQFREGHVDSDFMGDFIGNTDLMKHKFWSNLDSNHRNEAFKYMSLRDNIPHRVVSHGCKKKADIYIVISGVGREKNMRTGEVREVKVGSVLGAVDMFERYDDPNFEDPEEPTTYVSTLKSGCLVRLRLCDFVMSQYGPEIDKEAEYLTTLGEHDRLIYDSRKLATKSISPGLFDILDANDLLPTDPDDQAFHYLCKGNINRRVELRRGDPSSVFIILSGSIKVVLMRHMRSILALKEEDDSESITVKTKGTPLVTIEAGTVMCIDDSCFRPPSLTPPARAPTSTAAAPAGPPQTMTGTTAPVADTSAVSVSTDFKRPPFNKIPSDSSMISAVDNAVPVVSRQSRLGGDAPLFHLDLVFASTCNYIRLPKQELKNALKVENYTTTTEIVRQLNEVSQSIISRISDLDVWNSANIAIYNEAREAPPGSTWGAMEKVVIESKAATGVTVNGLHGTYRLPTAATIPGMGLIQEEEVVEEDAGKVARKAKSSSLIFNSTELDDV